MCGSSILSCCPHNPYGCKRALKEEEPLLISMLLAKQPVEYFLNILITVILSISILDTVTTQVGNKNYVGKLWSLG